MLTDSCYLKKNHWVTRKHECYFIVSNTAYPWVRSVCTLVSERSVREDSGVTRSLRCQQLSVSFQTHSGSRDPESLSSLHSVQPSHKGLLVSVLVRQADQGVCIQSQDDGQRGNVQWSTDSLTAAHTQIQAVLVGTIQSKYVKQLKNPDKGEKQVSTLCESAKPHSVEPLQN